MGGAAPNGGIDRPGPEQDTVCCVVPTWDTWIFEGSRASIWAERLERANMLIWLGFSVDLESVAYFLAYSLAP
ncbi:hypothetical protein OAM69_03120 [bacterium]|nr:hypothetical protein [bacterium]MDC0434615.1 hypothetical protein [bacterium]